MRTKPDVLATAFDFARRCGKVPVVAGVCDGFIGNRMLRSYNREAGLLLLEGATPAQVDGALIDFGMAMGPFAVADLSDIDIGYKAWAALPEGSYETRAFLVHDALVESGQLGQKTGKGFYLYGIETTGRPANPDVDQFIAAARAKSGLSLRQISDQEIVERCMLALANEGGFILSERVAERPSDIDVVYVNGYGFPRERGGPMFYVQKCGIETARARIEILARGPFGRWWKASDFFARAEGEQRHY